MLRRQPSRLFCNYVQSRESQWHDKKFQKRVAVRDASTPSGCRLSGSWRTRRQSKEPARKFAIDYHAARRHWINHVSAEARAAYIAGAGATKDQLEAIVADEALALLAVGTLGDPGSGPEFSRQAGD